MTGIDPAAVSTEVRLGILGRENAPTKARRYLTEARLTVTYVGEAGVRARCRGSGEVYALGFDAGRWWCSCPARGLCSHLVALQLVTAPGGGYASAP